MYGGAFTFIVVNIIIGIVIMRQKRLPKSSTEVPELSRVVKVGILNVNRLNTNNREINNLGDLGLINKLQAYGDNAVTNYFVDILLTKFASGDILTGDEVGAALVMVEILQLIRS